MLAVIACLAGVALILIIAEILWRKKILRGEYQRKFVHILAGTFIAFWPWIITFRQIQIISLLMLGAILLVQHYKLLHFTSEPKRAISKRAVEDAIISIAQQANPNVMGHTADLRAQLNT